MTPAEELQHYALIQELRRYSKDPMWAEHAEVPKKLLAAAVTALSRQVPGGVDGWAYELATKFDDKAGFCGWEKHISFNKPAVPADSIRNLRPLYAALSPGAMKSLFHQAWGYAKANPDQCSDGYDKRAFGHVEFWLDKIATLSSVPVVDEKSAKIIALIKDKYEDARQEAAGGIHTSANAYGSGYDRRYADALKELLDAIQSVAMLEAASIGKGKGDDH